MLEDAGALDEAVAAYRRAVELDPNLTEARASLAAALELAQSAQASERK